MKNLIITVFLLMIPTCYLNASESGKGGASPHATIGINGNYGLSELYLRDMKGEAETTDKSGLYWGGGLLFEKMYTGSFGLGSGIQYRHFERDLTLYFSSTGTWSDITWTFQSVNLPFYMIFSLSGDSVSLNLQLGFVYSFIFSSKMTTDYFTPTGLSEDNTLRFTNSNQLGLMTGLNLRIKITDFTDFMIGVTGEGYPTNLLELIDGSGSIHLYNYSIVTAWMFRTDFFSF